MMHYSVQSVEIPRGMWNIAGILNVPEDQPEKLPALVVAHPAGGVKEQTAGLYAQKMAEQGFVTLAFDASYQGESGGEPRLLEDPAARVQDIYACVSYLQTLPEVDPVRIGVIGICASGGYAATATMTDRRIRALATVSGADIGAVWRRGWDGSADPVQSAEILDNIAAQKDAELQGAEVAYGEYYPSDTSGAHDPHPEYGGARDYYMSSERGQHPRSINKFRLADSVPLMMSYDAYNNAENLFTQPLLAIVGSGAATTWNSANLYSRVRGDKKLVQIEGANHFDMYDLPQYVELAVAEMVPFFENSLAPRQKA